MSKKKTVKRIKSPTIDLVFCFMDNKLTVWAMIQYTCKKPYAVSKPEKT